MKLEKLQYEFSAEKNKVLIKDRSISFEAIISAINSGSLLDILEHPNKIKYPNQQIYVVNMDGYIYLVPSVKRNAETIFLKTIFPSRKLTKLYLDKEGDNDETT
ncbi:MAG: toxin [Tatlockia sp.]|nr:toxin [Tatlockia sp.]